MGRKDRSLRRNKATRQPQRRFFVFTEGEKTEPACFRALESHFGRNVRISLMPVGGAPMSVARNAVEKARELKRSRDSFEQSDQVWAVFDRDEHPNFDDAIAICASKGVKVGRSNPCFEVWLILHEEEFQKPDDRHQVCRHLRRLRPEYDPNGSKCCDFTEMIVRLGHAEERAAGQLEQRESQGAPFGRPSTTIGQLTAAIRDAAQAARRRQFSVDVQLCLSPASPSAPRATLSPFALSPLQWRPRSMSDASE